MLINKIIAKNHIIEDQYKTIKVFTIGFVLKPIEVKMIMKGSVSIKGAYIRITNLVAYIVNMHIHLSDKIDRMVLLNKNEIIYIESYLKQGYVCLPLKIYKYNNLIKGEFILAKYQRTGNKERKEKMMNKQLRREASSKCYGKIKI